MRKPHWERMLPREDACNFVRVLARNVRVEGSSGIIEDLAAFRRIVAARMVAHQSGQDPDVASLQVAAIPMSRGELIGDCAPQGFGGGEWQTWTTLAFFGLFSRDGERIYKLAREFGEELFKVDLNISQRYLPEEAGVYCIEFPDHLRFKDPDRDDYFHCAYVAVQRRSQYFQPVDRHGAAVQTVVEIILPCYDADGTDKDAANTLSLCFRGDEETVEQVIVRGHDSSSHPLRCYEVIQFIVKAVIYLNSGDPDLRAYRAPKPKSQNPKKYKRWVKEHENRSLVDMTLVGFDFKKPKHYSVNETSVSGHFRWQPCGPRKEKVKLIWIDSFIRHFHHEEQKNENQGEKP